MTIDPEMLMAYADGELDPIAAKRVERAIAADPALAGEIERHRALRDRLRGHFDPIAAAPLPEALVATVREAGKITDLSVVRAQRRAAPPARWAWTGGAVAAALVLGVMLGGIVRPGGDFVARGSALVASGSMARALDTQLAASQPGDAPIRMLVSFRRTDGSYCRAFESPGQGGIACRDDGAWRVQELRTLDKAQPGAYRQAGSDAAAVMADAQNMMAGDPLDAGGEQAAASRSWQAR